MVRQEQKWCARRIAIPFKIEERGAHLLYYHSLYLLFPIALLFVSFRCGITRCLIGTQKRGFALAEGAKPVDGEGAEWVAYPRERPGKDSAFNQSLNRCRISVKGDAFLNPTHQDLIARAKNSPPVDSKPDSSKTLPVLEAGTDSLSFSDFDEIMDGAVRQLRYY